jgi:DNA modification methylase
LKKWRRDIVRINPVIKINAKGENIERHTAPFPKEIPEFAIRCYSYEGNVVLDPFMGSGTTALVARELKRKWLGFEIHEEFEDVIRKKVRTDTRDISTYF